MQIRPFKALRFDAAVAGDVGKCVAAPYDVIGPAEQQRLYEKSPYNIVRIIKPKTTASDRASDNQYTRAARLFNNWVAEGLLKPDSAETIYLYVQDFQLNEKKFQRKAFIALGELEDFGPHVHPHENTLDAPKADRLNLTRATKAQFGQIFMLYDDEQNVAEEIVKQALKQNPLIDFTDEQNVKHRLFPVTKRQDVEAICTMMADKDVIIADGHHRYEAALNYYKQTQNPLAEFAMMTFVNVRSGDLVILPTHRLVGNLKDFDIKKLVDNLKGAFDITEFKFSSADQKQNAREKMFQRIKAEFDRGANAFGIYAGTGAFITAVLTNVRAMDAIAGYKPAWRRLDVAVLHKLILEKILGITEAQLARQSHIEYIKDIGNAIDESIAAVDSREKQLVFFMNPTTIEQVRDVAAQGQIMPQKSTFFYPKIFAGLTIYKL